MDFGSDACAAVNVTAGMLVDGVVVTSLTDREGEFVVYEISMEEGEF